jgi:hypothetical protein
MTAWTIFKGYKQEVEVYWTFTGHQKWVVNTNSHNFENTIFCELG